MFISSTSFLPSTLAMYCYTVMLAAWMNGDLIVALHLVAFAALVGWPFSVLVGVPLAIYILVNRGILFALTHGIISLVIFLGPAIAIDSQFYGKIVAAPLNILLYNVFGGAGPELYGVEPWYYYLVNGFLNFNFILILALACPLLLVLHAWKSGRWAAATKTLIYISGTFLWLGYMSFIPHKEERFLFVIYPWICFAAALSLTCISSMFESWPKFIGTVLALILLVIVALSVSRSASLYFNYEAPTSVYTYLYYKETAERDTTIELVSTPTLSPKDIQRVCVGKEWYRFPTHFFLPPHLRVTFIRDGFDGQLPQYYGPGPDSFSRTPENFNDLNKEEVSRYGKLDDCKYWVNFFEDDAAYTNFLESANGSVWREEYKAPFLSASRSTNPLFRAFYVPGYSEEHNLFGHYVLLERKTDDSTQEQTPQLP
jgi:alpha-1,2-mannosyltransferase